MHVLPLITAVVPTCLRPFSSDQHSGTIRLYDGRGDGKPLETAEKLHRFPVHLMTVRHSLFAGVVAGRLSSDTQR